jgi:transcriptional regulator with XRE-family HTH domain
MTDAAVLRELGARLTRRRIDAGLTQARLAEEAGISKRTVERLEAGDSTDFRLLVRALRPLKLIEGLENLVPDPPQSPIALARLKGRVPKRVRTARTGASRAATPKPAVPWKWGQ